MEYKKIIRKEILNLQASDFRLQRGVAIYLAIVIMFILLGIGLGISTILIGQIKISRGIENSVVALYAADTGIERALYEEKLSRLPDGSVILSEPGEFDNSGAGYTVSVIYDAGENIVRFKSIGEYKGVKRAIETSMLRPPPAPLAYWPLDGDANDRSGNGNNGTVFGTPSWRIGTSYCAERVGCLEFSGDDYIVVLDNPGLDITNIEALTISAWVKLNNINTFYFIVAKQPSGTAGANYPGNYEFRIKPTNPTNGALQFLHQISTGGTWSEYTSTSSISIGAWHHVAVVVVPGGDVKFYIDGSSAGTSVQSGNFGITNDEPVRIGTRKDPFSYFKGLMDQIRLYDIALSDADIAYLCNNP